MFGMYKLEVFEDILYAVTETQGWTVGSSDLLRKVAIWQPER